MSIEIDVQHNRRYKSLVVEYNGVTIETQGLMDENEARDQAETFLRVADELDQSRNQKIRDALQDIASFLDLVEDGTEPSDNARDAIDTITELTDF